MLNKIDYVKSCKYLNNHITDFGIEGLWFKIHYWGATPEHYSNPVHRHSFFEVCYVIDGSGIYAEEDDEEHSLAKGSVFFSKPGVWHQIRSQQGMYLLFFAFEVVEDQSEPSAYKHYMNLQAVHRNCLTFDEDDPFVHIWKQLYSQNLNGHYYENDISKLIASALMLSFYNLFYVASKNEQMNTGRTTSMLGQQLKLFIEDNLSMPLTLGEMAQYLHISNRQVSRLVIREFGQTFIHLVQIIRVNKAIDLLQQTDWDIQRIAQETGFQSLHYFSRVFASKIGISPSAYRKEQSTTRLHLIENKK